MSRWRTDEWQEEPPDEEEEELEGEWELDPNDPTHPDYDLSESAGYAEWEGTPKPVLLRRGMVLLLTLLIIAGLLIPFLLRLI
ncbi:MAG: hypothetical protein U1B78_02905 [Dehalococcoidia bacterium]|nr:hypothetical protein [Dehalococcoidia bacterium]MDZ4278069.1 hypothetical protein [Dehalococcoidia bacterium]